jgi:hypothetical protein
LIGRLLLILPILLACGEQTQRSDATATSQIGSVELATIATFQSPDPAWRRWFVEGIRLANGDYLLSGECHTFLFDSTGKFKRRVDREGKGPGETECVNKVIRTAGDSLLFFDYGSVLLFDPELEFVRRSPLGIPAPQSVGSMAGQPNGLAFVASNLILPNAKRVALYRMRPDWTLQDSTIAKDSITDPLKIPGMILERAHDGGFWAATHNDYEIQRRDTAGKLVRVFRKTPDWWHYYDAKLMGKQQAPESRILAMKEDASRRLWVLLSRPSVDWAKHPTETLANGEMTDPFAERNEVVLDILDPTSGQAHYSKPLSRLVTSFVDDSTLLGFRQDDDGNVIVDLVRVRISGK